MGVVNAWVGATGTSSMRVIARITGAVARLGVSTRADLTDPVWSEAAAADEHGLVALAAAGLATGKRHFWFLEVDGQPDTTTTGTATTHPARGEPASFTVAAASCAGLDPDIPGVGDVLARERLSNHPVFDAIAETDPLMFLHIGDIHYYDIGSRGHGIPTWDEATYLRGYDDVLAQPRQHRLYRTVPTVLAWDDHCYGANNSDASAPGRAGAIAAYRRRVPSYRLSDPEGIWQTWQIGRVAFVALDVRSFRSANTDPDGPGKTMLGQAQKAWLRAVLSNSTALGLVLISPSMWHHPNGTDTWAKFRIEQAELVDVFESTGWASRMVIVSGDTHSAGISTGAGSPGGIPVLQAAPLDSTPGPEQPQLDAGSWPGRGQYGLISVTDTGGDSLTIRLAARRGHQQLGAHTVTITTAGPGPGPGPVLPPPAEARTHAAVTWLACEAIGGRAIAELPEVDGQLSRLLGAHTSTSLSVAAPLTGRVKLPDRLLERATSPGRTLIAAILNDQPAWAGLVVARAGGTDAKIQLSTVTTEGYLDRRRASSHKFARTDQAVIATALLGDGEAKKLGGRRVGAGLGLLVDAPSSGRRRDREYLATDRKTIYACLTELMGITGGPEWTIDPVWADTTHTGIALIARVRNRIGQDRPDVLFTPAAGSPFTPGSAGDLIYAHTLDYSDGKGATWVQAYSSGQGDDQPASDPYVAEEQLAAGWPIFERIWQPSSSITDENTLNEHAAAELARISRGAVTWKLTVRADAWPRYGIDWGLGDSLAWHAYGHLHPAGIRATGRVIGVNLNPGSGICEPVLLEPEPEGAL